MTLAVSHCTSKTLVYFISEEGVLSSRYEHGHDSLPRVTPVRRASPGKRPCFTRMLLLYRLVRRGSGSRAEQPSSMCGAISRNIERLTFLLPPSPLPRRVSNAVIMYHDARCSGIAACCSFSLTNFSITLIHTEVSLRYCSTSVSSTL